MMQRPAVIVVLMVVGLIGLSLYVAFAPPSGVEPMGNGGSATIAWISLVVAIVSLLTAIVGLVQKVIELRASAKGG